MSSLSYADAIKRLEAETFNLDSLKKLVSDVSNGFIINADNTNVYTLYSGIMPDGASAEQVAIALRDSDRATVRDIGSSNSAAVVNSKEFDTALFKAVKLKVLGDASATPTLSDIDKLNEAKSLFMYGFDRNGNRVNDNSIWDIASRKYVESIPNGSQIRFLGSFDISDTSIFVTTELPAALKRVNDNLSIEGLNVKDLAKLGFNGALHNVLVEATGNAVVSNITPENTKAFLDLDALEQAKQTEEGAEKLRKYSKKFPDMAKSLAKLAKPLGTAGSLLMFFFVVDQAQAAIDAGDQAKADEIMAEWATGTAGGAIAGIVTTTIVGVGLAALAAAGITVSATVAIPVLLLAGVLGSIYGEDAALDLYRSLEDLDENGRRDILDRLWNTVAGTDFIPAQVFDEMKEGKVWHIEKNFSFANIQKIIDGAQSEDRQTRMAWRYALLTLNPFAVTNIDYDKHNKDGILDSENMTAQYIEDRTKMLLWKLEYDRAGLAYNSDFPTNKIIGNWDFIDKTIQHQGSQDLHLGIDGVGLTMNDHQIVFGSSGDDILQGSNTSDHLYGGAGNDILKAGDGNDYLEGGTGFDTYEIGKGQHTIYDVDQIGRIVYQGENIDFSDQNVWEQRDSYGSIFRYNNYTVQLIATESGTINLKFWHRNAPTDFVLIKDFQNGRMGIFIPALVTDPNPEPVVTTHIIGDKQYWDSDLSQAGIQTQKDKWGNTLVIDKNEINKKDELFDTDQNDMIMGLGGDDIIISKHGGSDLIYGGNGNDNITIYTDETIGWGENDNDIIVTHGQNNHLFGGSGNDAILSTGKNAYLSGGDGNDLIHANVDKNTATELADQNNSNRLIGGAGSDALISGNTSDLLYADEEMTEITEAWIEGKTNTAKGRGDLLIGNGGDDLFVGSDQNDLIITGSGNNIVYAGDGDDTVRVDDDYYYDNVSVKSTSDFTPLWDLKRRIIEASNGSYQYVTEISKLFGKEIAVNKGNNLIYLGAGNDWGYGGHGKDTFYGGLGNDVIFGMQGDDYIEGGAGNDILMGDGSYDAGDGNDYIDGGDGNDEIYGGGGNDWLLGGAGDDIIYGDGPGVDPEYEGEDVLDGGDGDDILYGGGKNDILYGGKGNDVLIGDGLDALAPNMGDDILDGGEGDDILIGGGGNDKLYGGKGNDFLYAGNVSYDSNGRIYTINSETDGDNYLDGGSGNDVLIGGSGNDTLVAGDGIDYLVGGKGNDTFIGGSGENYFYCDDGRDSVYCGSGLNVIFVGGELFNTGTWQKNPFHPSGWTEASGRWKWDVSGSWYDKESGLTLTFKTDDRVPGGNKDMMSINGNGVDVNVYDFDLGLSSENSMPGSGWIWMGSTSVPENSNSNSNLNNGVSGWKDNPGGNWVWLGKPSSEEQITGGIANDSIGFRLHGGVYQGGKGDDVFLNHCWGEDGGCRVFDRESSVTFVFNKGDGKDTILHQGFFLEDDMLTQSVPVEGNYTIRLGSGINEESVQLFADRGNVIIQLNDKDQIKLVDYSSILNYELKFSNGANKNISELTLNHDLDSSDDDDMIYAHSIFHSIVNSGMGNDLIFINKGTVNAGKGNDEIAIGSQHNNPYYDSYWGGQVETVARGEINILYDLGDGHDTIYDSSESHLLNTIRFGNNITEDMVTLKIDESTGDLLVLMKREGDQITIKEYMSWSYGAKNYRFEFTNGSVWNINQNYFNNHAPEAIGQLDTVTTQKEKEWVWTLPQGSFKDADKNDVLSYSARLSDGSTLPEWLTFNPITGRLSGTPTTGDINYRIIITATDKAGSTAEHQLTLTIAEFPLGAIIGTNTDDIITGTAGNDIIYGLAGDDIINGGTGNDKIYGGDGDDIINAGLGDDYVEAGAGNDYIVDVAGEGGGGNDTYLFRQGHGQDILMDQYGSDTVIFADLKLEDARFMREGDHLIIKGYGEDQLTINHHFFHANYTIENFQFGEQKLTIDDFWREGLPLFGDGENRIINGWGGADIIYGGSGNETITTGTGNDKIYGGDGDDIINAGLGDDYVEAGAGNDYIVDVAGEGGGGNDTYLFRQGHGQDILMDQYGSDTVIFADLKLEDARFMREGDHLIIKGYGEDQLTINHHFFHANYTIENFQFGEQKLTIDDFWREGLPLFGDGENRIINGWGGADIIYGGSGNETITTGTGNDKIYGGDGDDIINAGLGDDYVEAGAGNDYIVDVAGEGGGGNDTYLFRQGHGQDILMDQYGSDTVIFADLKLEDARFMREGDHLIIKGYGEDQLTINHHFFHANYTIENFQFGEQKLTIDDFWREGLPLFGDGENRIINGWGGADIIYGGSGNETITTGTGNDKIYGGDGDDIINAGLGDDYVEAGAGNDYIVDVAGEGGGGNDTYLFRQGHGQDILMDQYGSDTVIFADLKLEDARFMREGDHLIIKGYGEDQLTINHHFFHANYTIENFQFGEQKLTSRDILPFVEMAARTAKAEASAESFTASKTSVESQVNSLISAMAAFAPEAGSSSMLPTNQYDPSTVLLGASAA